MINQLETAPISGDTQPDCATVQLVCASPALAHRYLRELDRGGSLWRFVLALSAREAQRNASYNRPLVTLLDESALRNGESLQDCARFLTDISPVIVVASRESQSCLDAFISAGRLDFVPRSGEFVSVAAGLLERRILCAEASAEPATPRRAKSEDFGELLRHEVNNPLTGILGNAELLLARRDHLPPGAVERLETIAELAVRLRETVRRLSYTCRESAGQVQSV